MTIYIAYQWDWDKQEIFAIALHMHFGMLLNSGMAFYITSRTAFKSGTAIAVSAE